MLWIISWIHDGAGNGWPNFIGPRIFFFSAACAEKLREITTNAAMTPSSCCGALVRPTFSGLPGINKKTYRSFRLNELDQ